MFMFYSDIFSKFSVTWPALTLPENFDVIEYLLGMSLDYNLPTPVLLTLEPYLRTDKRYALSMYIKPTGNHDPFDPEKIACLHAPGSAFDKRRHGVQPRYTTIEALADDVKDQAPLDSLLNAINRHLPQHKSVNKDEEVLTLKNTGLVLKELLRSSKQAHYVDLVLFSGWNIVTSMNFGMSSSLLSCVSGKSAFGNSFQAVARCLQAGE
ncbi:hypothetical protein MRX96_042893 [Rhipicephalus microplus]